VLAYSYLCYQLASILLNRQRKTGTTKKSPHGVGLSFCTLILKGENNEPFSLKQGSVVKGKRKYTTRTIKAQ